MLAVVHAGIGNIGSIINALRAVGEAPEVVTSPSGLRAASRIVLPGVGRFDLAIERLRTSGLEVALQHVVRRREIPVLGICLGFQLLTRMSEEGCVEGLGWLRAETRRLQPRNEAGEALALPHMGWNEVSVRVGEPLFEGLGAAPRFYFVHSFAPVPDDHSATVGMADYGGEFVAAMVDGHVTGVQFHPEKSHRHGLTVLRNWVRLAACR